MNRYTIYCTEEQARKAFELGAPISVNKYTDIREARKAIREFENNNIQYALIDNFQQPGEYWCKLMPLPTAEQMIGWLEEKGLCISIEYNTTNRYAVSLEGLFGYIPLGIDSRKEATIAAIDAALDYMTKERRNRYDKTRI